MLKVATRERFAAETQVGAYPWRLAHTEASAEAPAGPVVVLHGLASAGRSLAAATLPLADHGLHVLLPDLLGHGASPYPSDEAYDVECHLQALRSWLDATSVGGEPVWLVGYSLGALLAIAWAAREPARIRGIVAISAPLFLDGADARRTLARGDLICRLSLRAPRLASLLTHVTCGAEGLGARVSRVQRLRRAYTWLLVNGYGPRPAPGGEAVATPADVEAGLLCGLEVCWLHSWESMYQSLMRCIVDYNIWPELEQVRDLGIPLRFIHGDHDAIAPVERVRLAAQLGHWPVHEYAGAAHSLAMTHAPALRQALASYLTEPGGPSGNRTGSSAAWGI